MRGLGGGGVVIITALLVACGRVTTATLVPTQEPTVKTPAATTTREPSPTLHRDPGPSSPVGLDGIWRSEGYGRIAEIADTVLNLYEATDVSLIRVLKTTLEEVESTLVLLGDQLFAKSNSSLHPISFRQIPSLPALTSVTDDPELNFEVFWRTFKENYAYFELYDVEWDAQYQLFQPQVTSNTTQDELFDIMSSMLRPIEDFHVHLASGSRFFKPGLLPHPLLVQRSGFSTISETSIDRIIEEFEGLVSDSLRIITETERYLNGEFTTAANNNLVYGKFTDPIGYLNIISMEGGDFSRIDDFSVQRSELETSIDRILEEFKDLEAIIVDVRFNGGGSDLLSLLIASRFADQKRLAFFKDALDTQAGDENFIPLGKFFVEPRGDLQFTKNITVLTGSMTASAAENFILMMMPFPYVTIIGEITSGAFSDVLNRTLPNGWEIGLSNERFLSPDGIDYQKIGIPPDIEIPLSEVDLAVGKDSILDTALGLLGAAPSVSPSVPSPEPILEVDPRTYDAYVGRYELSPEVIITITREDARLLVQATGQPEIEIYPESETAYSAKVADVHITFVKDVTGEIAGLVLRLEGQETPAERIND